MTWWRALARVTDRRAVERDARQLEAVAGSVKALGDQLRAISEAVANVTAELRDVQRQTAQLIALRVEDGDAPARMEQLENVLGTERVASHLAAATARAELADNPVPYLLIANVLPDDVYRAVVEAVPPPVFFNRAGQQELALPLTLAPVPSIAAWTFVTKVVRTALAPAILARFEDPLHRLLTPDASVGASDLAALTASRGHLALRQPGDVIPKGRRRAAHVLTTVVPLVRGDEGVPRMNLVLQRHGHAGGSSPPDPAAARAIPLSSNSALTFVSLAGTLEFVADPTTEATSGLHTYEFPFALREVRGPAREPA